MFISRSLLLPGSGLRGFDDFQDIKDKIQAYRITILIQDVDSGMFMSHAE